MMKLDSQWIQRLIDDTSGCSDTAAVIVALSPSVITTRLDGGELAHFDADTLIRLDKKARLLSPEIVQANQILRQRRAKTLNQTVTEHPQCK